MLAVFVERRRADAAQLPTGQRRLEEIGCVGAPLRRPGADHRVELIDEQDHTAGRRLHLAEDRLETVLELPTILCAGNQGPQIEGDDAFVAERLGDVRLHDPQRQPLGDRRLADARLADEDRVVFCPPRQHLDDAADLRIAADDRIELPLAGALDEIDAVFLERLELLLRILIGHPGTAADGLEAGEELLLVDRRQLEDVLRLRGRLDEAEKEMIGGDELVLHRVGLGRRPLENLHQILIGLRLGAPRDLGEVRQLRLDDPLEMAAVDSDLLQERTDDPLPLRDECREEMDRRRLRIAARGRQLDRPLDRFLGLDRELVESERHG